MTRPLIFSAPMVRALLDGRKTMTRRIIKPRPYNKDGDFVNIDIASRAMFRRGADGRFYYSFEHPRGGPLTAYVAYCAPGDRIWVKEAWAIVNDDGEKWIDYRATPRFPGESDKRAAAWDNAPDDPEAIRWRSPMFMPRWASRLTLIVESVRVERLQEISEADAIREGVEKPILPHWSGQPYRSAFRGLWLDIHGPGSWEANPWVAVIGFRVALRATGGPQVEANEKRNQRDENG